MTPSALLAALALAAPTPAQAPSGGDAARMLAEARCLACHPAGAELAARAAPRPAPSLERAGARLAASYVRELIAGGHEPDLLHGLEDAARERTVEALVQHIATLGGPLDAAPAAALPFELERGRAHYHELGCVACHGPLEEPWELELDYFEAREEALAPFEPDFEPPHRIARPEELARRTSVSALARRLAEEHAPALRLDAREARELALYLLAPQASAQARAPGLVASYYEAPFEEPAPDFDALEPVRQEVALDLGELPEHRADHYGFRFEGAVEIAAAGEFTFATSSDDGSRLYVDGELVVQNDGFHAMSRAEGTVALEPALHALELTYFERDGGEGLEVRWSGPGFEERPLEAAVLSHETLEFRPPDVAGFLPDSSLAAEGARLFDALRCGACHGLAAPGAGALEQLDPVAGGGCLDAQPAAGRPRYDIDADERAELIAALAWLDELARPLDAPERLNLLLERNHCNACHARQGSGGPPRPIWPYFVTRGHADLGDEGRIPPTLDEAGSKLRPVALRAVLLEGSSARPYMATRMPRFPAGEAAEIAELLLALDARPARPEPAFSAEKVEHGRRLAGVKGLACIQCHDFAGHPSLGIPAVDLATVHERLSFDWFARLLEDPIGLNMNTRMPEFWSGGKSPVADVLDGDPARQIEALWTFLSLGESMPLPEGLVVADEVYELVPKERPITCGVFMAGVSPRTLVVGFPEGVHYAFDVQNSRLAKIWRGRFFNARGTWEGRAGVLQSPPVAEVLDLPPGPAVAVLETADAPWPTESALRARGRRVGAEGAPTFTYWLGEVGIMERLEPELRAGGSRMRRRFLAMTVGPPPALYARLAVAASIREVELGVWQVDGPLPHRIEVRMEDELAELSAPRFYISRQDERDELRVAIGEWPWLEPHIEAGRSLLEVEISW